MADAQVQILIQAVDDMSKTVKNIEKTLEGMNKNVQKQSEQTSKAFTKQQGNLLILGQAAQSVDNIFSSYTNMQIRVENAAERVMGAQDRLADAHSDLNKVMRDSKSTSEDVADAHRRVEVASRTLTISLNNQKRTNDAVIGTYINMGTQVLVLIKDLPVLIESFDKLKKSIRALELTTGGWVAILSVAAGIAAAYVINKIEEKNATDDAKEAIDGENDSLRNFIRYGIQADEQLKTFISTSKDGVFSERELERSLKYTTIELNEQKKALNDIEKAMQGALGGIFVGETEKRIELIDEENVGRQAQIELDKLRLAGVDEENTRFQELSKVVEDSSTRQRIMANEMAIDWDSARDKLTLTTDAATTLKENTFTSVDAMKLKIGGEDGKGGLIGEWIKTKSSVDNASLAVDALTKKINEMPTEKHVTIYIDEITRRKTEEEKPGYLPRAGAYLMGIGATKKDDFIVTPQGIIESSPDDYIIGTKNPGGIGGGITINITGPVYGTDPDAIAEALGDKLSSAIRI